MEVFWGWKIVPKTWKLFGLFHFKKGNNTRLKWTWKIFMLSALTNVQCYPVPRMLPSAQNVTQCSGYPVPRMLPSAQNVTQCTECYPVLRLPSAQGTQYQGLLEMDWDFWLYSKVTQYQGLLFCLGFVPCHLASYIANLLNNSFTETIPPCFHTSFQ